MENELSVVEDAERSFEVAFVGRLKHAAFRRATERLGSQSAVARALGFDPSVVGTWINLKEYPKFSDELDNRLILVIGKGWHELWPAELRAQLDTRNNRFSEIRTFYRDLRASDLLLKKESNGQEIGIESEYEEVKKRIENALKTLPEREQRVLRMRFGLDAPPMTLEEVGKVFRVDKERIRQLERHAIWRLQLPSRVKMLASLLKPVDGIESEDQTPRHKSLKDKYPAPPPPPPEKPNADVDQKP